MCTTNASKQLLAIVLVICLYPPVAGRASDYYYYGDSPVQVHISDNAIVLQIDSLMEGISPDQVFLDHECVDPSVSREYVARGFYQYALRSTWTFDSAAAELGTSYYISRVVPVFLTADSAELRMTDLITVRFKNDVKVDSMLSFIRAAGLEFEDSSQFRHGLWQARLSKGSRESPLEVANALFATGSLTWSLPTFYSRVTRDGPSDEFYQYQYYHASSQNDIDIDADSAWLVCLNDSTLTVAIIGEGIAPHLDIPEERILPGFSVVGPSTPDDTEPATLESHEMAIAGIIGAAHNDTGIVGVFGSCRIVPVRVFYDVETASDYEFGEAISFAIQCGARVISCSWGWSQKVPPLEVKDAIEAGTDTSSSSSVSFTRVFVFSAGNNAQNQQWPLVKAPASMDEVLAVGGVDRWSDTRWNFSATGSTLDVVAPCGDAGLCNGDQWSVDQMDHYHGEIEGVCGINPDDLSANYTPYMGGTSGACPQVSGVAALILARRSDFLSSPVYRINGVDTTHLIVQNIIRNSAIDLGPPGFDSAYGYGRVNAYRALLSVIRGDLDNDGDLDSIDLGVMVDMVYYGGHATLDDRTADCNCDGENAGPVDLDYLIDAVFFGFEIPICFQY